MLSCEISVFKQNWLKVILCKKFLLYKVCKQILGLSRPVPHTAASRDMWQYWRVLASPLSGLDQSILKLCWIFDTHVNSQFWPTDKNPYFCKTILTLYFAFHPFLLPHPNNFHLRTRRINQEMKFQLGSLSYSFSVLSATFHPSSEPIFFIEFLYLKLTSYTTTAPSFLLQRLSNFSPLKCKNCIILFHGSAL